MNKAEASGKTLDAAIAAGLKIMNLTAEEVDVEVLATGGFLKNFRVRLTKKLTPGQKAQKHLEYIVEKMGFDFSVDLTESKDEIYLDLVSLSLTEDVGGGIIGHRGEVLDALQLLVTLFSGGEKKQARLTVDAEGYRARREKALETLAHNLESKVCRTGKYTKLEPMNPAERRIIHQTLQDSDKVETISSGEEPDRFVIIKLKGSPAIPEHAKAPERRRGGERGERGERSGGGARRGGRNRKGGERHGSGGGRREGSGDRSGGTAGQAQSAPKSAAPADANAETDPSAAAAAKRKTLKFVYRSEKKRRR